MATLNFDSNGLVFERKYQALGDDMAVILFEVNRPTTRFGSGRTNFVLIADASAGTDTIIWDGGRVQDITGDESPFVTVLHAYLEEIW